MALIPVPLAGQTLSDSRVPINTNFADIDSVFSIDHVGYNIPGEGQHNKISFPTQNPVPAPQAGIVQLYSQLSTLTTQPELVFTHQAGSTAPFAAQIVEFTSAGWANPGWTRLPSGILLKWHRGVAFIGSTAIVDLNNDGLNTPPNAPNFTTVFAVLSTTENPSANYNNNIGVKTIVGTTVTFSQFGIAAPGASVTITYLAIGI